MKYSSYVYLAISSGKLLVRTHPGSRHKPQFVLAPGDDTTEFAAFMEASAKRYGEDLHVAHSSSWDWPVDDGMTKAARDKFDAVMSKAYRRGFFSKESSLQARAEKWLSSDDGQTPGLAQFLRDTAKYFEGAQS